MNPIYSMIVKFSTLIKVEIFLSHCNLSTECIVSLGGDCEILWWYVGLFHHEICFSWHNQNSWYTGIICRIITYTCWNYSLCRPADWIIWHFQEMDDGKLWKFCVFFFTSLKRLIVCSKCCIVATINGVCYNWTGINWWNRNLTII